MKIAIQAADLDHPRIDGTRVYIHNLLKYFGSLDMESEFFIYHRKDFNSELTPPEFPNYKIKKIGFPAFWTQTRFAAEIWKDEPAVLWMPMHNLPRICRKNLKTFVTIHDLAFKYFPETFPKKDLIKLNFLTDYAIINSGKIIATSNATKNDILKFYPEIAEEKIKVIHHGFDPDVYSRERDIEAENEVKNRLGISGDYILYFGAIQPRKNLETLIEAFNILKRNPFPRGERDKVSSLTLVSAGEKAWLAQGTLKKAQESPFEEDIIMPGRLKFGDLGHLCRGAAVFVFPSIYEGFGIPVLEAMAAKVPVICANNSSLPEVGGDACLYFDAGNPKELADKIKLLLGDKQLREKLVNKGLEQIKKFSWEKCARETLEYLKS